MPNYAGDISPTRLRKEVSPVLVRGIQCIASVHRLRKKIIKIFKKVQQNRYCVS